VFKKIAVIGLGTLGGFIAKFISETEGIEKILIIDYDIVDERNIKNSIYKKKDVGKYKVDVLEKLIKIDNEEIQIIKMNEKFIENETILDDKYDLVIDSRDFNYNRNDLIDIRTYISGRYVIIDCRKNIIFDKNIEGKYTAILKKNDLKNAALCVTNFIFSGIIDSLMKKGMQHKIDLDYISRSIINKINKNNKSQELILDSDKKYFDLFPDLIDNSKNILIENNKNDINIYIGDREAYFYHRKVDSKFFKEEEEIFSYLGDLIEKSNLPYQSYLVSFSKVNKMIELIPETGAA